MFIWIQRINLLSKLFLSSLTSTPLLHGCTSISSSRGVVIGRKVARSPNNCRSQKFTTVDSLQCQKCIGGCASFFDLELRLSDGKCILVGFYVVQFILFSPYVFRRRNICLTMSVRSSRRMLPWNRPRTPQQNQLKFSCTSTYVKFLLCPRL